MLRKIGYVIRNKNIDMYYGGTGSKNNWNIDINEAQLILNKEVANDYLQVQKSFWGKNYDLELVPVKIRIEPC